MRNYLLWSLLILLVPCTAQAQFFFKKQVKNPAQRVPELVAILRGDPDERKRSSAADELREYDATSFPEIVPALAEAATKDSKYAVRSEALSTLARIRPVTQAAGQALEQAAANDPHWSNRMQAKSALVRYHWAGYTPSGQDPSAKGTKEPPKDAPPTQNAGLPVITTVPSVSAKVGTQPAPQNRNPSNNPYPISPNLRQNPTPAVTTSRPNVPTTPPIVTAPPISYPGYNQPMPSVVETPAMVVPNYQQQQVPIIVSTPPPGYAPPLVNSIPQPVVPVPLMPMQQPLNPLPTVETRQVPEPGLQFKPAPPLSTVETSKVVDSVPLPQPTKEVPLIDLNSVLKPNVNPVMPPIINAPPLNQPGVIPLPQPNGMPLPAAPEIPKF